MTDLILGQLLIFEDDPFGPEPWAAARHVRRGAIAVEAGRIVQTGDADALRAAHPRARCTDMGAALLLPGFVDAHMHYPQTAMIASWGKRLIDWLETYTFPEEAKFADPAYAAEIAGRTLDLALAHGTTSLTSFCTIHPASVDAFFEAAEARGMAVVAGKTCMDRNAPETLRDSAQSAYDDSLALLMRWHGKGRARYAITPRFSPTSSGAQLEALGALWAAHTDCLMQTHLSEQVDEVAWVRQLYPEARDYLDTYEMHGLLGANGLYGHAIHLEPRERDRLRETGAALVHCPTSNTFIGSGIFDLAARAREGQRLALATDTGGGSSFSMLRSMAAAYEIGQLAGTALHPAQLLWLATEGSARALRAEAEIGTLAAGSMADIVALDLASTPAIAQRARRAEDPWEALFPTIMMGDDRAIAGVWVGGTRHDAGAAAPDRKT
ncbi:guanine deaminase [Profundibacterium mesophilum]|uniref:Guanine deaminase n=1 Tax=Profundibacterium mesophilum KAUST100406-0324 TaxID=1037889 RepID=A0A921NUD6_9RHOB|nr:guanine deaminase [Profundibacterium mesophilum]KAF0675401.1 Guanine deaminase [Profundibacterium mesophilum KAUST100406-0324]